MRGSRPCPIRSVRAGRLRIRWRRRRPRRLPNGAPCGCSRRRCSQAKLLLPDPGRGRVNGRTAAVPAAPWRARRPRSLFYRRASMPGLLDGRIALITGAGSGIGEAIALAMAGAGARIVSVDINVGAAVRVAKAVGADAVGLACDVTDRPSCDALAVTVRRDAGPIGILVNNAGIIRRGQVTDANTRRDWDDTLSV